MSGAKPPTVDLDRIASGAAAYAPPWLREDIVQEVHLRFLIYQPNNKLWAWKIANGVRFDICRSEGKQVELAQALAQGLPLAPSIYDSRRAKNRRHYAAHRKEINAQKRVRYHADLERSRARTRERVSLHRLRWRYGLNL